MRRRLLWTAALGSCLALAPVGARDAHAAAVHVGGASAVAWEFPASNGSDITNVDQFISVPKTAHDTFWALQFGFAGQGGGYTGLQKDGLRADGSRTDQAIFSIFNANAYRDADGRCAPAAPEPEPSISCRMDWTFRQADYRLRVVKLESTPEGQWWGAWVYSTYSGHEYHLGDIRAASGARAISSVLNFSEYFGPQTSCTSVPQSVAIFTVPAANLAGGAYGLSARYAQGSFSVGACDRGDLQLVTGPNAARVTNGGAGAQLAPTS